MEGPPQGHADELAEIGRVALEEEAGGPETQGTHTATAVIVSCLDPLSTSA